MLSGCLIQQSENNEDILILGSVFRKISVSSFQPYDMLNSMPKSFSSIRHI